MLLREPEEKPGGLKGLKSHFSKISFLLPGKCRNPSGGAQCELTAILLYFFKLKTYVATTLYVVYK